MLRTVDISAGSLFRTFNLHPLSSSVATTKEKEEGRGRKDASVLISVFRTRTALSFVFLGTYVAFISF